MILLLLPPAQESPAPPPAPAPLRAQYTWGYAGDDGEGKGTLNLLLEPATGRVVLEIHGVGERLVLLTGNRASGYRVQIPRQQIDATATDLKGLPLPFLSRVGSVEALHRLLTTGEAQGLRVTRKDGQGPVKMRFDGKDDKGNDFTVWLDRTRWETLPDQP